MNIYTYENITVCISGAPFVCIELDDWQIEEVLNGRR